MALEVLGVALWLLFAGFGAWHLVTGRDQFFGLSLGIDSVRGRRWFGLFSMFVAGYFIFRIGQGSFSPEAIVFQYAAVGFSAFVAWRKSRALWAERRVDE
jgi:hypothetical protein